MTLDITMVLLWETAVDVTWKKNWGHRGRIRHMENQKQREKTHVFVDADRGECVTDV